MIRATKESRLGTALMLLAVLAGLVISGCAAQADQSFNSEQEIAMPSVQLKFENINPMIKMATAWGNKGAGAHGTFGQFPARFITPSHTHTGAYHGVVIKGVMTNPFGDEKSPPEMGPGSYWYVPAGAPHATACVSATPCEFYFHAEAPFDFVPVE